MRINSIKILNYRQHRHTSIEFPQRGFDLHLLVAENGVGKTNVMNAINWCLYEEEPYAKSNNGKLPICNEITLHEGEAAGHATETVSVVLNVTRDDKTYEFSRTVEVSVKDPLAKRVSKLTVSITQPDGNSDLLDGEEARNHAIACFPKKIREYFFFDSEQLTTYFDRSNKELSVKEAVNEISQVNVLDNAKKHLDAYIKECGKVMSNLNPMLKEKQQAVEDLENTGRNLENDINSLENTNENARLKIEELDKLLNGNENVSEDNRRYNELSNRIDDLENERKRLDAEQKRLVSKYYVLLVMYDINTSANEYIRDKEARGDLPTSIDPEEIVKSLDKHECTFCKTGLSHSAEEHLRELLKQSALSTKAGGKLTEIKNDVEKACREARKYTDAIDELRQAIEKVEEEKDDCIKASEEIKVRLNACSDVESVATWFQQRDDLKKAMRNNDQRIGSYRNELKNNGINLEEAREELKKAQQSTEKCDEARRQIDVAREVKDVIDAVEKDVSGTIRTNMEAKTMEWFDTLLWKKNTYKEIHLNDKYDVELIDNFGRSCLGSCSAAEKQMLALAFTLALHKVSGYDGVLFIDTPMGRVSGENRANFADVLRMTGLEKQIILTLTSAEFSENVRNVFTPEYRSSMTVMKVNGTEKEVITEVE